MSFRVRSYLSLFSEKVSGLGHDAWMESWLSAVRLRDADGLALDRSATRVLILLVRKCSIQIRRISYRLSHESSHLFPFGGYGARAHLFLISAFRADV